jgi:type IV pilus assembly protein PilP
LTAGCEDKPPSQPSRETVKVVVEKKVIRKKIARPVALENQKQQADSKTAESAGKTEKSETAGVEKQSLETIAETKVKASSKEKDHRETFMVEAQSSEKMYNPAGRIDPFAPLFQKAEPVVNDSEDKTKRKKRVPQTPLEKIDLSQLRLVAIIRSEAISNRGLVEEASGKGYIIKEGTYIGTNAGRVVQILPDKAIVEEETVDFLGKVKRVKKELKLQKTSGE